MQVQEQKEYTLKDRKVLKVLNNTKRLVNQYYILQSNVIKARMLFKIRDYENFNKQLDIIRDNIKKSWEILEILAKKITSLKPLNPPHQEYVAFIHGLQLILKLMSDAINVIQEYVNEKNDTMANIYLTDLEGLTKEDYGKGIREFQEKIAIL